MSVSEALGERKEVSAPAGDDPLPRARHRRADRVRPRPAGERRPVAQGRAGWRRTSAASRPTCRSARTSCRCTTDADLTPPGVAKLIADFLAALDLENVTLVGNDTGGALCQIVVTQQPGAGRPPGADQLRRLRGLPAEHVQLLFCGRPHPGRRVRRWRSRMRFRRCANAPIAFGWLTKSASEREISDGYVRPGADERRRPARHGQVPARASTRRTRWPRRASWDFDKPGAARVGAEKDFFPLELRERLAATFPNARLEAIDDSLTFVPEDQPERLAELIAAFAREPAARDRASRSQPVDSALVALARRRSPRPAGPIRAAG